MKNFFLTLHMISMCLVIGTLFLQSLTVVFRLRLKSSEESLGLEKTQTRIHKFIYYPILGVTLISGIVLAIKTGAFSEGKWIQVKLLDSRYEDYFQYHLFQLKTWVALVKGLNLTFHNIELNTIMQNVFLFIPKIKLPKTKKNNFRRAKTRSNAYI